MGSTVYLICQWLITLIVVWLYDDLKNAGNLALAMSITNVFYNIALYNVRAYQVSDVNNEYSDSEYIANRATTCLCAILLCAVFILITGYPFEQALIILCYMIFRSAEAFIDILHGILHKHWRLDIIGKSMIMRGLLMLTAFSLLGWLFDLLPAIIAMIGVTALLGLLYDYPQAKKLATLTSINYTKVKNLLKQCFLLMLVMLILSLLMAYARYALERMYGTEELGAYATAATPAIIVQTVVSFMFAPVAKLLIECIAEENKSRFIRILAVTFTIIFIITLIAIPVAYLIGQWGLALLFGERMIPYAYLLPSAMVVAGVTSAVWFMNIVFATIRDIKWLFAGCLAGLVTCIAVSEILIREFRLIGTNYAMIVCQGVLLIILGTRLTWHLMRDEHILTIK